MDSILNDWKKLLRHEISQKSLYYRKKDTRSVKDFQKLANKEIYLTINSNITKYSKLFKFIKWSVFVEGQHILMYIFD